MIYELQWMGYTQECTITVDSFSIRVSLGLEKLLGKMASQLMKLLDDTNSSDLPWFIVEVD